MLLSPSKRLEESKGAPQKCRRYVTSQVFYLELCKACKVSIGEGADHFLKDQKRTLRTIFKAVFLLTHLSCSCCQLENVPEASCLSAHCLRKWLNGMCKCVLALSRQTMAVPVLLLPCECTRRFSSITGDVHKAD